MQAHQYVKGTNQFPKPLIITKENYYKGVSSPNHSSPNNKINKELHVLVIYENNQRLK